MQNWNIEQARKAYNVRNWSNGYFDINDRGNIIAIPDPQKPDAVIDLHGLIEDIRQTGLSLPVLIRFTDILHDRVKQLAGAFTRAMQNRQYQGNYTSVYPIKVNQQFSVVNELFRDENTATGLEAGSKPELMAVLALSKHSNSVIVCNGYKDREYIRLALIGKKLGNRVYIVIEKLSELELILQEADNLGIQASIGLRMRLSSMGAGLWQNTGGEKSKFGLSAAQALSVIERLKNAGKLDTLEMLHFHMGSQLPNIKDIQKGVQECAHYFAELHRLGAAISCVDVGGGLGINYDGTQSRNYCSMNYDINDYANIIIDTLASTCREHGLPHPDVITESGRALTAHHAVLVTNVVDTETVNRDTPSFNDNSIDKDKDKEKAAPVLMELEKLHHRLTGSEKTGSTAELYHDATSLLSDAHDLFTRGKLSLQHRATAEKFYFSICWHARTALESGKKPDRDILDDLNEKLADKYFCNFSIFQSIPDVWAISQIFPITPIHRLDEEPLQRGRIHDITCDSDGRIDSYVDGEGIESSLPLHEVKPDEEYCLGFFLVGAYQEILGDIHNLFGDTDSINVALTEDNKYVLSQAMHGDTVSDVLASVKYQPDKLLDVYETKISMSDISKEQKTLFLEELRAGFSGYTYLED